MTAHACQSAEIVRCQTTPSDSLQGVRNYAIEERSSKEEKQDKVRNVSMAVWPSRSRPNDSLGV